jgi:hypothetical protein
MEVLGMKNELRWALATAILVAAAWGCGSDNGGTGGGNTGGSANTGGKANTGGSTGGSASTCDTPGGPGHTDCMGSPSVGHKPGKEEAKTNCASCHTPDLGKAAGDNCWGCHNPASTHTASHGGVMHRPGGASKNSQDAKCVPCHAPDQQGLAPCTPCHQ